MSYVEGVIRGVVGFNKTQDENGERLMEVEYDLRPIDINLLREAFKIDLNTNDQSILDIIDPFDINEEQAKFLQPYVINGVIDLDKYHFVLHCWQDPNYDWVNGHPVKRS